MKLCMVGTGYVGLVSGTCFADLGNKVYCVDKDPNKIKSLNAGISPIYEPGLNEIIKKNYDSGRLIFTSNLINAVRDSDIIFVCVGTPNNKKTETVNLSYVYNAVKEIIKVSKSKKIIVSTIQV